MAEQDIFQRVKGVLRKEKDVGNVIRLDISKIAVESESNLMKRLRTKPKSQDTEK